MSKRLGSKASYAEVRVVLEAKRRAHSDWALRNLSDMSLGGEDMILFSSYSLITFTHSCDLRYFFISLIRLFVGGVPNGLAPATPVPGLGACLLLFGLVKLYKGR